MRIRKSREDDIYKEEQDIGVVIVEGLQLKKYVKVTQL